MRRYLRIYLTVLMVAGILATPGRLFARVTMFAYVNGMSFNILPASYLTVDDWLSNPNMWTVVVQNTPEGGKSVENLTVRFTVTSPVWGEVITGRLNIVGAQGFKDVLEPGDPPFTVTNTMINNASREVSTDGFSDVFVDEVIRIGYMPEGIYTMTFEASGYYGSTSDPVEVEPVSETIEIKNPLPPDLLTPDDGSDNVPVIPRFAWIAPEVSDLGGMGGPIQVDYTIKVWKLFDSSGRRISEETAIERIPVWQRESIRTTSVDFDPSSAIEELISGGSYCWQVQGFDGTGRPVSPKNDGKSDVWEFTVQYQPPTIIEPVQFYPLRFSWTPAYAGGNMIQYTISIADNPEYTGAYEERGYVQQSYSYPDDAPPIKSNITYYLRIQPTDDQDIPLGSPAETTFQLPSGEITLSSPDDGSRIAGTTPHFYWQGYGTHSVVTVFDPDGSWRVLSPAVEGMTWRYDAETLERGKRYGWYVTPSDQYGDAIGDPSDTWYFTTPSDDQVTLVNPVNVTLDTVFPEFRWERFVPASGDDVHYLLVIRDAAGVEFYTVDTQTEYHLYPHDAPAFEYATRYSWSVTAMTGDEAVGRPSDEAWFITPFVESRGGQVTITELDAAFKTVLMDYPQYRQVSQKVLTGIYRIDESGNREAISPGTLMELLGKYTIVDVTEK